ncbi:MAG TPA: vWA domain-containing protein [Polyangia bacterium]|jgi:hypothetical protein|nr:vWA domain-containing protein [Polyangia bacterium]
MRLCAIRVLLLAALLVGCGGKSSGGSGGKGGGAVAGVAGAGGASAGTGGNAGDAGSGGSVTGSGGVAGTGAGGLAGTGAGGLAGTGGGGAGSGGTTGAAGTAGAGANVDAATDGDAIVCTPGEHPALRGAPDVLILLDASGSMNDDVTGQACQPNGCGATSKWALLIPAIEQIVATTQTRVNWGLKFFPDTDNRCGVSPNIAVPIGPGSSDAIALAIMARTSANGGVTNGGQTPTRVVETAAADVLSTVADTNPKFILLATDGIPNCLTTTNILADDSAGAINAVSTAAGRGFATFVVGIATGINPQTEVTLSQMAVAGGRPRSGSPEYYPVASTDELLATLDGIVGQAGMCTLGIGQPPPGGSLDAIDVRGDGAPIARDVAHVSGWDYADPGHTSIALFGAPCTALRNATVQQITIVFRCP